MNIKLRNDREMSVSKYLSVLLGVSSIREGRCEGKAEREKGTRQSSCRVGAEGALRNAVSSGEYSSLSEDPFLL